MSYKYNAPPSPPMFGPLPDGDYYFVVSSVDEPYSKNDKWILPLKLSIQPDGVPVFANLWAGRDKNGNEHDQIAEFLVCVNRAPEPGQEPNWTNLIGARGKCRLKTEIASLGALAGKEVNKVHYFYVPKQIGGQAPVGERPVYRTQKPAIPSQGGQAFEPDDIPY